MSNGLTAPGSSPTWLAPAVLLGFFSILIGGGIALSTFLLGGRFTAVEDRVGRLETRNGELNTRIDQRFDKLSDIIQTQSAQINSRLDKLLESQSALTIQASKTDSAVADLNNKVDKISLKLKVASSSYDSPFVAGSPAVETLEAAGFKVLDLKAVSPPAKEAVVKEIANEKDWYAVTIDDNKFQNAIKLMENK